MDGVLNHIGISPAIGQSLDTQEPLPAEYGHFARCFGLMQAQAAICVHGHTQLMRGKALRGGQMRGFWPVERQPARCMLELVRRKRAAHRASPR
jgi:hypothetical protein